MTFLPISRAQYEHEKAEIALRNEVFQAKVALEKAQTALQAHEIKGQGEKSEEEIS